MKKHRQIEEWHLYRWRSEQNITATVYGCIFYLNPRISLLRNFQMKLVLVWVFNVPLPFLFLSFGLCGGFVSICPEGKEGGGKIRQVSPQHTALLSVPNQLSLIAEEEGGEKERRGEGVHSIQSPAK